MREILIGLLVTLIFLAAIISIAALIHHNATNGAPLVGSVWVPVDPPEPGWACWTLYVNRGPMGVWCREAGE